MYLQKITNNTISYKQAPKHLKNIKVPTDSFAKKSLEMKEFKNKGLESLEQKLNSCDFNVFGYDDFESQERREFIREHYLSQVMPYYSIYETQGRKTEQQMKDLIKILKGKPKILDYALITGEKIANLDRVGKNSLRGESLVYKPEVLKSIKRAGIERIVDLVGYDEYKTSVKNEGLEYFSFPINYLWDKPAFRTKEDVVNRVINETRIYHVKPETAKKMISDTVNAYEKDKREFINDFIKLIKVLQKDYFYIGWEYGTYLTDSVLLLNTIFNPKCKDEPIMFDLLPYYEDIVIFYKNLTPEDKKEMGWDKDFEDNFYKRLDKAYEEQTNY